MNDKSNCDEHFWSSSHEIQLGREWEPSLLARRRDELLFLVEQDLDSAFFINNRFGFKGFSPLSFSIVSD